MPAIVNRYKQLMASVPKGSFYASSGQTLPHRSTPYTIRVTTSSPSTSHDIYNNDVFVGRVITDSNGVALVSLLLELGQNNIKLVNPSTASQSVAYVTTKTFATWLASIAQVIESIDEGIEQTLENSRLQTVTSDMIDTVFGQPLSISNTFGMDTDTFRNLLWELKIAYRHYGGTIGGVSRVVRAILGVSPLIYSFDFFETWKLGTDMLYPGNRSESVTTYTSSILDISVSVPGYVSKLPPGTVGTGTLRWDGTASTLDWLHPTASGNYGDPVLINGPGTYYVPGYAGMILLSSHPEPYDTTGVTPYISLDINDLGRIDIPVTAGGAVTATTIVSDLNAALNLSPLYGAAYGSIFAVVTIDGTSRVSMQSTTGSGDPVRKLKIYHRRSDDQFGSAAPIIFDHPYSRLHLGAGATAGATSVTYTSPSVLSNDVAWPDTVDSNYESLWCIIDSGAVNAEASGSTKGATPASNERERIKISSIDKSTNTINFDTQIQYNHSAGAIVYLEQDDCISVEQEFPGVEVVISGWPAVSAGVDTYDISMDSRRVPDRWSYKVSGSPGTMLGGYISFFDTEQHPVLILEQNGEIAFDAPDSVLDYAGYNVVLDIYTFAFDGSTSSNDIVTSVDFGSGPVLLSSATSNRNQCILARPRKKSYQVTIPGNASMMRISISSNTTHSQYIQKVILNTSQQYYTGSNVGLGTVIYGETAAKAGSAMFVWGSDDLSQSETDALGLGSVIQDGIGQIDAIVPANVYLAKYDVTNVSPPTTSNVIGYFNESDWSNGTSVNMETIIGTPAKYSYMAPTTVSMQTETVTWAPIPSYTYTLAKTSTSNLLKSVLLVDGVPLTQDEWQYNSDTEIELLSTPSTTSVYTFIYEARVQYTTDVIDCDIMPFTDVPVFADYHIFSVPQFNKYSTQETSGIDFDEAGVSRLAYQSDQNKATSRLIEDQGLVKRIVPASQWRYVSENEISIDLSTINVGSLYTLEYVANRVHVSDKCQYVVEHRSHSSSVLILSEPWTAVGVNSIVPSVRYHQFRVNITNIEDVKDVRLNSLLVKCFDLTAVPTIIS